MRENVELFSVRSARREVELARRWNTQASGAFGYVKCSDNTVACTASEDEPSSKPREMWTGSESGPRPQGVHMWTNGSTAHFSFAVTADFGEVQSQIHVIAACIRYL